MNQTRIPRKVPKSKPIFNLQRIYQLQAAERLNHKARTNPHHYFSSEQQNIDCQLFNFTTCTQPPVPVTPKPPAVQRQVEFKVLEDSTKKKGISVRSEFTSSALMYGSRDVRMRMSQQDLRHGKGSQLLVMQHQSSVREILRPMNRPITRRNN